MFYKSLGVMQVPANLNHPIFDRFFGYLETCGGCTGPRDPQKCAMAVMCASVEVLGKKGAVRDKKKRSEYTAGVLPYLGLAKSSAGADTRGDCATSSPGPSNVD